MITYCVYCLFIHIFASKHTTFLPHNHSVDNTLTGTPLLVALVTERYECLTSDHESGGSNPAEDIIWES